jgi:hypothetical protein
VQSQISFGYRLYINMNKFDDMLTDRHVNFELPWSLYFYSLRLYGIIPFYVQKHFKKKVLVNVNFLEPTKMNFCKIYLPNRISSRLSKSDL